MRRSKRNLIICGILSFLLSVFLTMVCFLIGLSLGLFHTGHIQDIMQRCGYYHGVIDKTYEECDNIVIPMGLEVSVLDRVFTQERAKKDSNFILNKTLNHTDEQLDLTELNEKLTQNVKTYVKNQNIELNDEQEENITVFTKSVLSIYADNLTIPFISYYSSLRQMFQKITVLGIVTLSLLSLITIFIIFKIRFFSIRAVQDLICSGVATGLMLVVAPLVLLLNGFYSKINISPEYVQRFFAEFIKSSLMVFIYLGIGAFILSMILLMIDYSRSRK